MRKAGAFILLLSLFYYYVISLMIVETELLAYKTIAKLKQSTGDQITLSLTTEEFQQYRQGDDELCIHGKMFDIQKKFISGNEVLVVCTDDKIETKILAELENFFNQNTHQDKSAAPNMLFKFLSLVYIPSFYDQGINAPESNAFCFRNSSLKAITAFFSVSTPPPRGIA